MLVKNAVSKLDTAQQGNPASATGSVSTAPAKDKAASNFLLPPGLGSNKQPELAGSAQATQNVVQQNASNAAAAGSADMPGGDTTGAPPI